MPSSWIYRTIRLALACLFLVAGAIKITDPHAFALLITDYGLIPDAYALPLAVGLPVLEVIAAIGLLFDVRGSLSVITGLLVVFIAFLGYGIRLGLDVDCGCFGPGDPEASAYHGFRSAIYRDIVMLLGAGYLYFHRLRRPPAGPTGNRPRDPS